MPENFGELRADYLNQGTAQRLPESTPGTVAGFAVTPDLVEEFKLAHIDGTAAGLFQTKLDEGLPFPYVRYLSLLGATHLVEGL